MGTVLFVIVVVIPTAALFTLVAIQRRRARSWRDATHGASDDSRRVGPCQFEKVWVQSQPPRSSMRAYRDRQTGTLHVDPTQAGAVFQPKTGQAIEIANVSTVDMGGRGSDFVNTWIEVHADVGSNPTTLYLMDGGWLGWRPLLTGSNRRIVTALAGLTCAMPG